MSEYIVPVWENKTAPCGGAGGCPAHTDIASALHALSRGEPEKAWQIMMRTHPLRSTLGRICYAFCETPCNRGSFDTALSIQHLEAIIGDNGFNPEYRPEKKSRNGKKVLIVGAGPAGLTAGWFLNIDGFEVTIREKEKEAGGVLRYGIPSYRLPKDVLAREIALIENSGVRIETGSGVVAGSLGTVMQSENFDAAIVSVGAGAPVKLEIDGAERLLDGLKLLKEINSGNCANDHFADQNLVVIGGGNVAMDSCRSAVRLGAKSVTMLYRRTKELMPAHEHEFIQASQEGVLFRFLMAPAGFNGSTLTADEMRLGAPDKSGRESVEPTGKQVELPADVVIVSAGREENDFIRENKNIYYAGDVNPDSPGTVIHAIAGGREVARKICLSFGLPSSVKIPGEEVSYEQMNILRYFEPSMRMMTKSVPARIRKNGFEPVDPVADLAEGIVEADRCFRCGLCIGGLNSDCDWCFRACGARGGINKLMVEWHDQSPLFERDPQNCDVCGKCWEDCPRFVVTPSVVKS